MSPPTANVRSWDEIKADKAKFGSQREYERARAAETVGGRERAGDSRADASADETAALRKQIEQLKADNAQQKAEIDQLKSDIAEIKEALRQRDPDNKPDASDSDERKPGDHEEHKPGDKGVITHFHGKNLDLYTDGTRWVSGDALQAAQGRQEQKPEASGHEITEIPGVRGQGRNVVGEKDDRSPGDTSGLPPTGEQLLETDEHRSRADAFRRKSYEAEDLEDVNDIVHDDVDLIDKLFDRPPASGHADVPLHHPVYAPADTQHAGASDLVMGSLVASIVVVEGARAASHRVQNLKDKTHEMIERHKNAGD